MSNLDVKISRSETAGIPVIVPQGEIDLHTGGIFKEKIAIQLGEDAGSLIVDLDQVDYLDSTTLAILVGALKHSHEKNGHLAIICSNENILRIFKIAHLNEIFDIYATMEEAESAIIRIKSTLYREG